MHSGIAEQCWRPAAGRLGNAALEKARIVAHRLATLDRVDAAYRMAHAETRFPRGIAWMAHSIAQGCAGLAVLDAYCDSCFPGEGWDMLARDYLRCAAEDAAQYSEMPLGIFSRLAGVAFASWQASRGGTRYQRLRTTLDSEIFPRAAAAAEGLRTRHHMYIGEYDLISGLSGTESGSRGGEITRTYELLPRQRGPECVRTWAG